MKRPLSSQTILVTRPGKSGAELSLMLEGLGAAVTHQPAIQITTHKTGEEDRKAIAQSDFVLITSAQACRALERSDLAQTDFQILAVGAQTGALAEGLGWKVAVTAKTGGLSDLVVACRNIDFTGKAVVWPRSNLADFTAVDTWRDAGARVHDFVAYEVTNPLSGSSLDVSAFTAIFFASPSAVENFENAVTTGQLADVRRLKQAVAIGSTTAKELRDCGWQHIIVASLPSNEGLLAAALEHLSESTSL